MYAIRSYYEVGLGLVPLLRALVGDAALVEQRPVPLLGRGDQRDGAVIGRGGLGELALAAQDVAERGMGLDRAGIRITSYNVCYTKLLRSMTSRLSPSGVSSGSGSAAFMSSG